MKESNMPQEEIDVYPEGGSDSQSEQDASFMMETDMQTLFQTFFMEGKKERNVVDVLLEVRRSLDTNNKIMLKMLTILEKYVTRQ